MVDRNSKVSICQLTTWQLCQDDGEESGEVLLQKLAMATPVPGEHDLQCTNVDVMDTARRFMTVQGLSVPRASAEFSVAFSASVHSYVTFIAVRHHCPRALKSGSVRNEHFHESLILDPPHHTYKPSNV
ncbi:hypothetical protein CBL_02604 [Carabus blaptoides fortunei]